MRARRRPATYTILGQLASETQSLAGLSDDVTLEHAYDVRGLKTSTSAKIGTADDYVNEYDYDNLGRLTKVTQQGQGGNAVAEKRVDLAYADDGLSATFTRYADLDGEDMVAQTKRAFDALGRVKSITHADVDTVFADYSYEWDEASRISEIDFDFLGTAYDDTVTYGYDDTSQLTAESYNAQADHTYDYDQTGNRDVVDDGTASEADYTTGDHNRMLSDGTYTYLYDDEGNRTAKFVDNDSSGTLSTGDTDITEYEWDHRNRLIEVTSYDTFGGAATQQVEFTYTHENQMIARIVDGTAKRIFVHESGQIVLQLDDATGGTLDASDLSHCYFWNPTSSDSLLADDAVNTGADSDVLWAMLDHLNTVRDLLRFDGTSTSLANHLTFDAFGNLVAQTATTDADKTLFTYTGKVFETVIGLQWSFDRWYDPATGNWISVDPISFAGRDANLYRYAGNIASSLRDSRGLESCGDWLGMDHQIDRLIHFQPGDWLRDQLPPGLEGAIRDPDDWAMQNLSPDWQDAIRNPDDWAMDRLPPDIQSMIRDPENWGRHQLPEAYLPWIENPGQELERILQELENGVIDGTDNWLKKNTPVVRYGGQAYVIHPLGWHSLSYSASMSGMDEGGSCVSSHIEGAGGLGAYALIPMSTLAINPAPGLSFSVTGDMLAHASLEYAWSGTSFAEMSMRNGINSGACFTSSLDMSAGFAGNLGVEGQYSPNLGPNLDLDAFLQGGVSYHTGDLVAPPGVEQWVHRYGDGSSEVGYAGTGFSFLTPIGSMKIVSQWFLNSHGEFGKPIFGVQISGNR